METKVTVFDGKAEKTLEFEVQAPCQVAVVERSDSGSSSTIHKKQSPFDNGRWESSDATCTLFEGDPQTFEVEGTTLEVVGDTLVDTQMQANVAARKASFDEAKAGLG